MALEGGSVNGPRRGGEGALLRHDLINRGSPACRMPGQPLRQRPLATNAPPVDVL